MPRVTVVCVPRDHHHDAVESLETLLDETDEPFDLVYVIGRAPVEVREYVRARAAEIGFTLIERDEVLVPNHARNLALEHVTTDYVVFLDNDAFVARGWLEALIACADDTGAAIVGPLQYQGPFESDEIHLAGGFFEIDDTHQPKLFRTRHRFQGLSLEAVPEPLVRQQCDFAEFHCMLVRREILDQVGPFDEHLLTAREIEDFCLLTKAAGETVWFEPTARVAFHWPVEVHGTDIAFISRRWSQRANRQSFDYFFTKHDLDRATITALGFVNGLRRPIFAPVRRRVAKLRIRIVERGVAYLMYRADAFVNWLLIRPGPTSL